MIDEVWVHDSLSVDDDGYVVGSAYTDEKNGYSVSVAVMSYEYTKRDGTKMNHVPNVVISDSEGKVVNEVHSHDSESATKAIRNAKSTGKDAFENLSQYVN